MEPPLKKRKLGENDIPSENDHETLYIFDLDETLIIFQSLLDDTFAKKKCSEIDDQVQSLGESFEFFLNSIMDKYFDFMNALTDTSSNVRDWKQVLSAARSGSDSTKEISQEILLLSQTYMKVLGASKKGLLTLLDAEEKKVLRSLVLGIDKLTSGWISTSRRLINQLFCNHCRIVIVSSGALIPTFAKTQLFGLPIPISCLFSSASQGKLAVFQRVMALYPNKNYVAVGDGNEEKEAALHLDIPFQAVNSAEDLSRMMEEECGEASHTPTTPDCRTNTRWQQGGKSQLKEQQ
eukprot:GCRY01005048.1.p1 GENE.GCRY01005048.1~~GCRY01005048.1.p1  ORF type:complete len:293 (+),score=41.63 GCRY01005048.1:118-996(+)